MALDQQTGLSCDKPEWFLGRHETGVLSLPRDGKPYAIPLSYRYHVQSRELFLRLLSTPEGEKRAFLEDSPRARNVVYADTSNAYRSVVAAGPVEEIQWDELAVEHVEQDAETKRTPFEIWDESKRDLDVDLYRLDPDFVNGGRVDVDRQTDS